VSFLRRALERRDLFASGYVHEPGAPMGTSAIPSNSDGYAVTSGASVTDRTALGLTAFYACVRLLADVTASLPWDAYRKRGEIRQEVEAPSPLLTSPSAEMDDFEFKHTVVTSLAIRGNCYGDILARDTLGYPIQIELLHPDEVRIDRDPDTGRRRWWRRGGLRRMEDLFHIPFVRMPGSEVGLSPVGAARQSLGLGLAAQEYGGKWFRDGANPSGVLSTEQSLTMQQVQDTQRIWIASHGGRRLPAVTQGGLKWQPISITPEESQFLETRQYSAVEVAQLMGVPPHMIGIVDRSTSWGTGIEQQSIGFVQYSLGPSYLSRIEKAITRCLPRGQFCKFNVNGLLRGDVKSRYEAYQIAVNNGWMNPDEIRALEERPPIPGGAGQKFRQPLNMGPLGAEPDEESDDTDTDESGADAGNPGVARLRPVRGSVARA
jgi:HK97 family phage portal protein